MTKIRVAVGLSGGVDSAVVAYLLKKQGFDVSGVYLHCFGDDIPGCRGEQDRQDALSVALHLKIPFQVLDFRRQYKSAVIAYFKKEYLAGRTPNPDVVCNRDIKFGLLLDWCVKNGFDYLATGHYAKIVRKSQLKSANISSNQIADKSDKSDSDLSDLSIIRSCPPAAGRADLADTLTFLARPADEHKDQTYFLWAVPRQNFSRVLFPLADFRKKDVRSLAKFAKVPVADKPDSTGICFIGEVRVGDFLKRLGVKEKEGEVVVRKARGAWREARGNLRATSRALHAFDYEVIGRHRGVWFYTIGQRHGFSTDLWSSKNNSEFRMENAEWKNQSDPTHSEFRIHHSELVPDRPPLYVIAKDIKTNRLIVGFGAETYREKFAVGNCNWLIDGKFFSQTQNSKLKTQNQVQSSKSKDSFVRIRHGGELIECSLTAKRQPLNAKIQPRLTINGSRFTVRLREPQRGVAPGQSAVFYDMTGIVLGGGVIQ